MKTLLAVAMAAGLLGIAAPAQADDGTDACSTVSEAKSLVSGQRHRRVAALLDSEGWPGRRSDISPYALQMAASLGYPIKHEEVHLYPPCSEPEDGMVLTGLTIGYNRRTDRLDYIAYSVVPVAPEVPTTTPPSCPRGQRACATAPRTEHVVRWAPAR